MDLSLLTGLPSPLVIGILLGGLYASVGLGLSLVFGVMKLINVAHGDLVILATYLAYGVMTILGMDPFLGLVIVLPIMAILGYAIQRFIMSRAFGTSAEAPLLIAFGISLVIQNVVQLIWSPLSRGLNTSYSLKFLSIGSLHIPLVYLLDFLAAVVVMLGLREFLRRTYLGKAINAASQDSRAAKLMGINTEQTYAFAFAIAMAITAVAGVCLGLTFPFTPQSGVSFLVIAFGVVILGGMGNILGTFVGGIILGLSQTLGAYFFGAATQLLFVFLIVFILLAVRPQGIFGR
jgi:branched-chain amino acid transport system permease protein